ncbi:MAG: CHRD domain-containing protein [Rubrivivax sp.]|nr:CHRD domain-containing protein [Rubrivivax sp.]
MRIRSLMTALALAALPLAAAAEVKVYGANLAPEVAGATGNGYVQISYDTVQHTLAIATSFAGLSGNTTVAHIHCCVNAPGFVGVAVTPGTLPGFPVGVSAGSYSVNLNLTLASSFTGSFVAGAGGGTLAGAESALIAALDAGRAYFNVHSSAFPSGEIRGFVTPVPEPSTVALMALGLAAIAWRQRHRWQGQREAAAT